jgi:hypothetical protein
VLRRALTVARLVVVMDEGVREASHVEARLPARRLDREEEELVFIDRAGPTAQTQTQCSALSAVACSAQMREGTV